MNDLLRTIQSYLERESPNALCPTCWAIVPLEGAHVCDVEGRAAAMVKSLGILAHDETKRAKGYSVP